MYWILKGEIRIKSNNILTTLLYFVITQNNYIFSSEGRERIFNALYLVCILFSGDGGGASIDGVSLSVAVLSSSHIVLEHEHYFTSLDDFLCSLFLSFAPFILSSLAGCFGSHCRKKLKKVVSTQAGLKGKRKENFHGVHIIPARCTWSSSSSFLTSSGPEYMHA